MNRKQRQLRLYLDSLYNEAKSTGEAEFSSYTLDLSWQVWIKLRNYFLSNNLCLEVPDACPGSKDNFMFTWSNSEHYLECEIFGNQEVELFYRNRNNEEVWGEDTKTTLEFSPSILDKVKLFAC